MRQSNIDLVVGNLYTFDIAFHTHFDYYYYSKPSIKFTKEEIEKIGVYYKDRLDHNTVKACSDLEIIEKGYNPMLGECADSLYVFTKNVMCYDLKHCGVFPCCVFYDITNNKTITIWKETISKGALVIYEAV